MSSGALLVLRTACPARFLGFLPLFLPWFIPLFLPWFVSLVLPHLTPCVLLLFVLFELVLRLEWLTALTAFVLASLVVLRRLLLRHYVAPLVV
jgi:hypothetical protein